MDVIASGSQQPFFCALGHFRHGDEHPNEQPSLILQKIINKPMTGLQILNAN